MDLGLFVVSLRTERLVQWQITFFAHLVSIDLVSESSFIATLQSLVSVLSDERDDNIDNGLRTAKVIRTLTAALLRAGPNFYTSQKSLIDNIVDTIAHVVNEGRHSNAEGSTTARSLCTVLLNPEQMDHGEPDKDLLDQTLQALRNAQSEGFVTISFLPEPYARFPLPEGEEAPEAYELSQIVLAAPVAGQVGTEDSEGWISPIYPDGDIQLNDGRVPNPSTPSGWVMLTMIQDMIHLYEVNRTDCAKILLSLPSFVLPETFLPPPPKPAPGEEPPAPVEGEWVLATTLVSIILASLLRLPNPAHKVIYYTSLIRELCLLEGAKIAPPLGLAVRSFYSKLDEGVDVEMVRRFAEWFSTHLSNFVFQWLWKDW